MKDLFTTRLKKSINERGLTLCLLCGHDISPFITIYLDGKEYKRCRRCEKKIMLKRTL